MPTQQRDQRTHAPRPAQRAPLVPDTAQAARTQAPHVQQVRKLQSLIGNQAVQRLIQRETRTIARFSERDITEKCIAPAYAEGLSDDELQQAIQVARDQMAALPEDDPIHLAAAENLLTLRQEHAKRDPAAGVELRLEAVEGASDAAAHRQAADALIEYVRGQLQTADYRQNIETYLQQAEPDADEKVAVLGRVAAAAARMEFLLGNIYHQGGNSWEINDSGRRTSNRGAIVDDYTGGTARAWCSNFATQVIEWVRGGSGIHTHSGYRIANPDDANVGNDLDYDTNQGGAFVGLTRPRNATTTNSPFAALRSQLRRIDADDTIGDKEDARASAADDFLDDHIHPQAGDMMIVRRGSSDPNEFSGDYESHTTIIESVDGHTIYTIEGNVSSRVTGRAYDLTDPADVEEIIFIARPSLVSGRPGAAEQAEIGAGIPEGTDSVNESDLIEPIDDMNELLQDFATDAGYINDPEEEEADTVRNLD